MCHFIKGVPLATEPAIEETSTKFEQEYVHCVRFFVDSLTTLIDSLTTLTEVFPCFFLSCKANARVKLTSWGTVRTLQK